MAVNRYYSNTAVSTTLSGGVNNSVTSMVVGSVSGFPVSFPYTLVIDRGTVSEELVTVTAAAGTTLTVTRGVDNTTAVTHSAGAAVEHTVSARDFREPQEHIDNTTTAHGVTGAVVGTTNTQTLTNKTLTTPTITNPTVTTGSFSTPTLTSPAFAGTATGLTSLGGAWSTYTPTWTVVSGTNPTLGNGSWNARYFQIGKLVFVSVRLGAGGTTTAGSGTYQFSLPVACSGSALMAISGSDCGYGSGGSQATSAQSVRLNSTTTFILGSGGFSDSFNALTASTLAEIATFYMRATFIYEAA